MAEDAITEDVQAPAQTEQDSPQHAEGAPQPEEAAGTRADQPEPTDWEKRFKDTQSSYTQAQQRIAELEAAQAEQNLHQALTDPDQQEAALDHLTEQLGEDGARQWLEANGYELEPPEQEDEEFRDPRVDQLLEREQKKELDAQVKQVEAGMETALDKALEAKGLKQDALTPELRDLLLDAAVLRPNGQGDPDVQGVFDQWSQANEQAIKQYRQSKRDAPSPPVPGGSGTPNPSLTSSKDRLAAANAIADEAYAEG